MAELAVRARPLLGFYQGHRGAGRREWAPDAARLFSALLHAAGTGSTAVESNGTLVPSPQAREALSWLEEHPPSVLHLPVVADGYRDVRSYRDEGVLEGKGAVRRKVDKGHWDGFAVDGYFGWGWQEDAPPEVVSTLEALCADVTCLGESDSPFILEVAPIDPTHVLDPMTSAFAPAGGHDTRVPTTGRLKALEAEHAAGRPSRRPSISQDKASMSQLPVTSPPLEVSLVTRKYREVEAAPPDLPWTRAVTLLPHEPVPVHQRVQWAVTLHRALIAQIGDGAPALLTGRYPRGAARPANRVAIQYVAGPTQEEALRAGGFLVLLPKDVDPDTETEVVAATRRVRRLYGGGRGELIMSDGPSTDLEHFWLPPLPGARRRWAPRPAFVPETRRQRGGNWSLESSVRLSVGFAFRDRLELGRERSQARYERIVEQVEAWGVRVERARVIPDSRLERYVHRVPDDLVAQPVDALVDLDGLVSPECFLALGQSRHLGGGALHPVDSAEVEA